MTCLAQSPESADGDVGLLSAVMSDKFLFALQFSVVST